jgi:hypothetical protein
MALTAKLEAQGNSVPSATATQLPPKKPTQSHNYYLRAQIRYILANLDFIKPSRLRGKVQDRLRELVHELRNSKGMAKWAVLLFAGCCFGFVALIAYTHQSKIPYVYQYPADTIQIVHKIDPFHYQMRQIHADPGNSFSRVFSTTFCSNYSPMFSEGETLTWLAYEDRGDCWSVSSKALGYTFLRDAEGNVELAPNCSWVTDVLAACKGEPKW